MNKDNRVTDIFKDLKRERCYLHCREISKKLNKLKNKNVSNIQWEDFSKSKVANKDFCLSYSLGSEKKKKVIEGKVDSHVKVVNGKYVLSTSNLVLELVSAIDVSCLSNLDIENLDKRLNSCIRSSSSSGYYKRCIKIYEDIRDGKIRGRLGYAVTKGLNGDNLLSYIFANGDNVVAHYIYRGDIIKEFVESNYNKLPITVTKTLNSESGGQWYTISLLVPIKDINIYHKKRRSEKK